MPRYKHRKFNRQRSNRQRFEIPSAVKRDVFILFIFALALFSIAGIFGWAGRAGEIVDEIWQTMFGWAWWAWPIILIIIAYLMINKERYEIKMFRWLGLFLFVLSYSGILHFFVSSQTGLEAAQAGAGGGFLGYFISFPLISLAGFWGGLIILIAIFLVSLLLLFEKSINDILEMFHLPEFTFLKNLREKIRLKKSQRVLETQAEAEDVGFEQREISDMESAESLPAGDLPQGDAASYAEQKEMFPKGKKKYPMIDLPIDLLNGKKMQPTAGNIKYNQETIKKTLSHFGI